MRTILLTGFGPFPGAPVNPTEGLVEALARARTQRARVVPHVFHTSYAAVDRELPVLLRRHRPDALLMFGLAAETPHLRIETWARNALSALPDAAGVIAAERRIAPGRPGRQALTTPARAFLAAARRARLHAAVSKDAGDYLCNYLCWRASFAVRRRGGPRLAAFIHVPEGLPVVDLVRAGRAFLAAFARHV